MFTAKIYVSVDEGYNWSEDDSNVKSYVVLDKFQSRLLVSNTSENIYSKDLGSNVIATNTTINGFVFDCNNLSGVFGNNGITGFALKWCHIKNSIEKGLLGFDNPTIYNNIFENCYNGSVSNKGDYQENLFYNIENYAVDIETGNTFTFEHNTVYLARIGLLVEKAITSYTLKNNIIHDCSAYPISSLVTQLTALNSLLYGTPYNCLLGTQSYKGVLNPLFKSEDVDDPDFRIQVTEDDNVGNSLAKQNADDNDGGGTPYTYDSGCYLITRALNTDTFGLDITLLFPPRSDEKKFELTGVSLLDTASGDIFKDYDADRQEFTFTWNDNDQSNWNFFNQLMRLIKERDGLRMLPHANGMDSGVGNFNASPLTFTIGTANWDTDYWKGYGVKISLTAGDRYFRITSNTDTVLTLENIEDYTGLANENNKDYSIEFIPVKCVSSEVSGKRNQYYSMIFGEDVDKPTRAYMGHSITFKMTRWV